MTETGKDDKRHGQGTRKWKAGAVYLGFQENGAQRGHGKIAWADRTYEGDLEIRRERTTKE